MTFFSTRAILLSLTIVSLMNLNLVADDTDSDPSSDDLRPILLAHYMPWYQAKPFASNWGWHWTMNVFDPESVSPDTGLPSVASHYHPLMGPYDSGDPDVLECQLLQMKLAGIDGVIVDWYGLQDFRDYALLHRNTSRLVEQVSRLGMKLVICYEDQTVPALVDAGRLDAVQRVAHVASEIEWLRENWFSLEAYVHLDGKPVLLSFGQSGLSSDEWKACLKSVKQPIAYVSQHHRREAASGAFDWPIPKEGVAGVQRFLNSAEEGSISIPVVFPRFVDIYAEANVHESWGRVEDDDGRTFRETLRQAIASRPRLIQIATWNDWGEGTIIEPSHEFGYRDLQHLQTTRRTRIDANFRPIPADLKLPVQVLRLRRRGLASPQQSTMLDDAVLQLSRGKLEAARTTLQHIHRSPQGPLNPQ